MAGAAEGGAELFFERLCVGLHHAGCDILPIIRSDARRMELLRRAGMAPVGLAFGAAFDVMTGLRMRRKLLEFRPDVAIYWMNRANQHRSRGPWISVARLGGYYDLRHYRGCDHLVANTRGIVEWLRAEGWSRQTTHYLPNFVADFATTRAADVAALRLPSGDRLILALGRLHTDKGFDTLIRSLSRIPRATLVIAGDGPERGRLQQLARVENVSDRVRFLGWREDAGALLKAASVFVCSSRIEPLGNMTIEAWSASCPIVSTAAAGPRELIRDGRDGIMVPLEDPVALGDAIARILDDPLKAGELTTAGRLRFELEFSETTVIAQWLDFFQHMTIGRPG